MTIPRPRCGFYVRLPVSEEPLLYRYELVMLRSYMTSGRIELRHLPSVGDLISLIGDTEDTKGVFRVLERCWMHSQYGSMDWPVIEREPKSGPLVDVIVERAEGPFANEASSSDEEDE